MNKDRVNLGRQKEVDLFRGFTAIVLILCHVALYLGNNDVEALYVFGDIIGSEFGAPVFMSMMGISIIYSRHNEPKDLFKRGIILFLSGYGLNMVRSLLPYLIVPNIDYFATFEALFIIDILPFAGLAFMLIALLKKIKLPTWGILVVALVFGLIDEIIFTNIETITDNTYLACFLNLFVPVDDYSCFPFLTWFFFPAFGLHLGDILSRTKDKKKLYTILGLIGLFAFIYVYGSFIYLYPYYASYYAGGNFYYMGVINLIVNGLLICFGLAFWYFISELLPKCIDKYLSFLSKNLNVFYWLSWILIGSLIHIFAYYNIILEPIITIILMVVIQALTSLLTQVYINLKKKIVIAK